MLAHQEDKQMPLQGYSKGKDFLLGQDPFAMLVSASAPLKHLSQRWPYKDAWSQVIIQPFLRHVFIRDKIETTRGTGCLTTCVLLDCTPGSAGPHRRQCYTPCYTFCVENNLCHYTSTCSGPCSTVWHRWLQPPLLSALTLATDPKGTA